jgi:hypothetical protein
MTVEDWKSLEPLIWWASFALMALATWLYFRSHR